MKNSEHNPKGAGAPDPYHVLMEKLTGKELTRPRCKTGVNLWRKTRRDEIEAELKKRLGDLKGKKDRLATERDKIAREMFSNLDAEEQRKWKATALSEHSELMNQYKRDMELLKTPSPSPVDRQRCIQNLTHLMRPILDMICDVTGWKATLLAGGPEPAHDGQLNVVSIHSGNTTGDLKLNFGFAELERYKEFIIPTYESFLQKCYTPEECRARALSTDGEFVPMSVIALEDKSVSSFFFEPSDVPTPSDVGTALSLPPRVIAAPATSTGADNTIMFSDATPEGTGPLYFGNMQSRPPSPGPSSFLHARSPSPGPRFTQPTVPALHARVSSPIPSHVLPASPSQSRAPSPIAPMLPTLSRVPSPGPSHRQLSPPSPQADPTSSHFQVEYSTPSAQSTAPNRPAVDRPVCPPSLHFRAPPPIPKRAQSAPPLTAPFHLQNDPSSLSVWSGIPAFPAANEAVIPATVDHHSSIRLSTARGEISPNEMGETSIKKSTKRGPESTTGGQAPKRQKTDQNVSLSVPSTSSPLSASVTTFQAPDDAPKWFVNALSMVQSTNLGPEWAELIQKWSTFEAKEDYVEIAKLGHLHRPASVGVWIRNRRSITWRPRIDDPSQYGKEFMKWWTSLQPTWRISAQGKIIFTATDGDWKVMRRPGANGLLSVIGSLFHWGIALQHGDEKKNPQWIAAVQDCITVYTHLLSQDA